MSRANKRKHVLKEIAQDYFASPSEGQAIVKIISSRGNNLHEVETNDEERYLVSMPTKFRKNIWVKRGDFVIVEPIAEGDKVKAEMVRVLSKEHIKYFKKINVWPTNFVVSIGETCDRGESSTTSSSSTESDTSDCDDSSFTSDSQEYSDGIISEEDDISQGKQMNDVQQEKKTAKMSIDKLKLVDKSGAPM